MQAKEITCAKERKQKQYEMLSRNRKIFGTLGTYIEDSL
jgi:hypothetical protein